MLDTNSGLIFLKVGAHIAELRKIKHELVSVRFQYGKTGADFLNLARTGTASVVPGTHTESLYMHKFIVWSPDLAVLTREPHWLVPDTTYGHRMMVVPVPGHTVKSPVKPCRSLAISD